MSNARRRKLAKAGIFEDDLDRPDRGGFCPTCGLRLLPNLEAESVCARCDLKPTEAERARVEERHKAEGGPMTPARNSEAKRR